MTFAVSQSDALTFVRELPAGEVAAMVTDPPYCSGGFTETARRGSTGQGVVSQRRDVESYFEGDNMGTAGLVWLLRSLAFEVSAKLRPGGSLLVACDWRQVANIGPAIESSGLRWTNLVVWDKGSPALGVGFRAQHELFLQFTNGTSKHGSDKSTPNVIRAKRVPGKRKHHFAEKPLALLRQLIRPITKRGELVVDPFCGSGAVGCAALAEGRRFLGCDRDAGFVEVARQRLELVAADPLSNADLADAKQTGLFAK